MLVGYACFKVLRNANRLLTSSDSPWATQIVNHEDGDHSHPISLVTNKVVR
jgi:hypothetical protein